ncbi:PAS domain-containing sensor histidine kinase [Seleniivibrio woodruffii]|uniref:sensor histidine kinase n=1 Tax=Seleniivibrio woodruffii TaxID=1078050 RepID=UPI0026F1BF46|nr:PAS domain-containing sensor histidine kinase [Seleniivibrio woodruffii]
MRHILTLLLIFDSMGQKAFAQNIATASGMATHAISFGLILIVFFVLILKYLSEKKSNRLLQKANDELIAAKNALTRSELRFTAMAENLDDIIWFTDTELRRMVYINKSYERIYGKSVESLYNNPESYIECIHPDDLPDLTLRYRNVTVPKNNIKHRVINRQTGEIRWVLSRYAPVKNSDGETVFISGIISDITPLVNAENEKAVQKQIIAQQAKFASLGEMIGAISHQWRQPLNTLYLYMQLMEESENKEEIAKYIEDSMKLIDHMSDTIEDFRDFFKTGKQPEPFDAPRTVTQILRMLAPQMKANNITYHVNCTCEKRSFSCSNNFDPGNPPCRNLVSGIANEFKHAILNILQNAKEALTEQNRPERDIYIDMSAGEGKFTIAITDSAGGIDTEFLPHIFEAYSSDKKEGTGMGLYMTKTIIEDKMNGRLWAENTEIGAKFTIELPCISSETQQP